MVNLSQEKDGKKFPLESRHRGRHYFSEEWEAIKWNYWVVKISVHTIFLKLKLKELKWVEV
jgi:hypothetical protein